MQVMYDKLFNSLFEIVTFLNRPSQDRKMLEEVGIELDAALFPLLVRIGRGGPFGIVELADQLGKDYSTISRQVDKLLALELIVIIDQDSDKRSRKVGLSKVGKEMIKKITVTRRKLIRETLADWDEHELINLEISLEHLVETIRNRK
jgi:DNA-binding MarR family transcriptional regulator